MRRLAGVAGVVALGASLAACGSSHGAPQRPIWDGYGQPTAPLGTMMLCPRADAGNAARLADGTLVECEADGSRYAWLARAGCLIPGTRVVVPSLDGARFGGEPHFCVDGTWQLVSVKFSQS